MTKLILPLLVLLLIAFLWIIIKIRKARYLKSLMTYNPCSKYEMFRSLHRLDMSKNKSWR